MTLKIKICGMKHPDNIQEVLALKPDYLGFICYPKSARYIGKLSPSTVSNLQQVTKTGVFVNARPGEVIAIAKHYGFSAIQLHGDESPDFCAAIKKHKLQTIKAFGIHAGFEWRSLSDYTDTVDLFLFDTKSTDYGGTGKVFDWSILAGYGLDIPYFLSGGLAPENIQEAYRLADPRLYGLDLNSKFELTPGLKNVDLLKRTLQMLEK